MSLTYKATEQPLAYDTKSYNVVYYSDDVRGAKEAEGKFEVIPRIKEGFESVFAFGQSGCGKSTWCAEYAMSYRRIFSKNNIFLFSQKDSDPAFDNISGIKIRKIKIDKNFLEREIDVTKDFKDCLIIFDDFLSFENDKTKEKIVKLVIQVLTLGRCNNIYCVITSHLMYQMKNRDLYMHIQNEVHKLVFFKGCSMYQLTRTLREYWGFQTAKIHSVINIDPYSRWISLNKYPEYILTENICVLGF